MIIRTKEFHKATIGFLALTLLTATIPAVLAQTAPQGQLALRAVTRDDITLYKLSATTQVSGGLSTVGIGQPAYLEALVDKAVKPSDIASVTWELTRKPFNSKAALVDSPLGKDVPFSQPAEREVSQVAGRKLLRPDVVGQYTVTATVAGAAGTLSMTTTITGGTYIGIKACGTCHSVAFGTKATSWAKTAHASIFKDGMNGIASDHYSASCLGCHTVGYDADPAAVNGGFDDIADQLKWTFPTVLKEGTFDSLPDALKNVGNIQCENCHGPGSQHVLGGGDKQMISVSASADVCAQCHNSGTHHVKTAEWNNSMHAVATRDPSGDGREGCVGCHTGAGFTDKMKGAATMRTAYTAINCQSCHESHGQTTPEKSAHLVRNAEAVKLMDGTVVNGAGAGALCMNCHQSRRNAAVYAATEPASARFGPHHGPQADMLAGANAFTYSMIIPSSAHGVAVEDTCVTCHMQAVDAADPALTHVGGHTFKPSWESAKGAKVELVGACQKCHGERITTFNFPLLDYDGDGVIDGVQTEVQHLLDKLSALLPPAGKPKSELTIDTTWTRAQLEAAYNWQFVKEDGSLGVHNMAYAVGLLKASIADVSGAAKK